MNLEQLKPYVKTIVAFVAGVIQVAQLYLTLNADSQLTPDEINALLNAVLVVLTGTGAVYLIPNKNVK